jgi:hypothetical protein
MVSNHSRSAPLPSTETEISQSVNGDVESDDDLPLLEALDDSPTQAMSERWLGTRMGAEFMTSLLNRIAVLEERVHILEVSKRNISAIGASHDAESDESGDSKEISLE